MKNYIKKIIKWERTDDPLFPFKAMLEKNELKIGINDFPDEPLYSVYVNGKKTFDLDSWPVLWKK